MSFGTLPSWTPGSCCSWLFYFDGALFLLRSYSLKAQDRIIRLEERLLLHTVLSAPLGRRIPELTEAQLIAVPFTSEQRTAAACREGACGEDAGAGNQEEHHGVACRYISRMKPGYNFKVFHATHLSRVSWQNWHRI